MAATQMCVNTKCKHHVLGGGCRLFVGLAWLQCRKAVAAPAKNSKRKTTGAGRAAAR